jgi:hypothetical protein
MDLDSDIKVNVEKFLPSSISDDTHAYNQKIRKLCGQETKWYDVGTFTPWAIRIT